MSMIPRSELSDTDDDSSHEEPDLKDSMLHEILQVHSTGYFATSGIVKDFTNPGISIDTLNLIRLPLSIEDAQCLIKMSHRAPFGKGTETLVDESIRKTWQIDADKVQFQNEKWQTCLDRIVETVVQELGVAGGSRDVRADLHKMLIYEEGAMFKTHKEDVWNPSHLPPAKHTGGSVNLQHGGKMKTFASGDSSAFDATYMAWYTDVDHEIEPVQSGYRWVLVYNLVNNAENPDLSAGFLEGRVKRFADVLEEWQQLKSPYQSLIYPLNHQYTNESLRLQRLKGQDFYRVSHIAQGCAENGAFRALLANMEYCITDHQDEDTEKETELYLTRIVDLGGFEISVYERLYIGCRSLLGGSPYNDRDADIQQGGGYLGNQHGAIDQIYKDSVVIMIPDKSFESFLLGGKTVYWAFEKLMSKLRVKASTDEANWKAILLQSCHNAIQSPSQYTDLALGSVAVTAVALREPSLFTEAIEKTAVSFGQDSYAALGRTFNTHECPAQTQEMVKALTKCGKLHQIFSNLSAFRRGLSQRNLDSIDESEARSVRKWLVDVLFSSLGDLESASSEDARCVVNIIIEEEDPLNQDVLYRGVCGFIDRFSNKAHFSIPCVIEILLVLESSTKAHHYLSSLLSRLIEHVVSLFNPEIYASYMKKRFPRPTTTDIPVKPIASLYNQAQATNTELPYVLLERIESQANSLDQTFCDSSLVEFLSDLLSVLNCSSKAAQKCVHSLLIVYITRTVGYEPLQPSNWSRHDEVWSCWNKNCKICPRLNKFLGDSKAETCTVPGMLLDDYHHKHNFNHLDFEKLNEGEKIAAKKTLKHWQKKHKEWEERVARARKEIGMLPAEQLRECLAQQYEDILDMKMVKNDGQHRYLTRSTVPQKRQLAEL